MWIQRTKQPEEPTKLKNVLVLHGHNSSADYLATQPLKGIMAPNMDSYDGIDKNDHFILDAFRSPDGIQYHHFKFREIRNNPSESHNIAPCMDALEKYISARGEKLDAIVVTSAYGTDYQNAEAIQWLSEMKNRFPGVKVLVDGYLPRAIEVPEKLTNKTPEEYIAEESKRIFAVPKTAAAEINNMIKKATITPASTDYVLAAPIDCMPVNDDPSNKAYLLRELMRMPPYKERGAER